MQADTLNPGANPSGPRPKDTMTTYLISSSNEKLAGRFDSLPAALEHIAENADPNATWTIGASEPDKPPSTIIHNHVGGHTRPLAAGDTAIETLTAAGREDLARDLLGDDRVDDWFREQGIDPDAARDEPTA